MAHACHLLHSQSQLEIEWNREQLRDCAYVVIAPTFDAHAAQMAAPAARVLVSFNAKALYLYPANAYWREVTDRLLGPRRPNGTPRFVYDAAVWGGSPQDPGESAAHVLIEPTGENADALAGEIQARLHTIRDETGVVVQAYLDDAPRMRPGRLRNPRLPKDQVAWEGYLARLIANLAGDCWVNCGMHTPHADVLGATREIENTPFEAMCRLSLARRVEHGMMGFPRDIYWGGVGVDQLFLGGVYLRTAEGS